MIMESIDIHQREALEKMRHAFGAEEGYGLPMLDSTFLRYLRARSFHYDQASQMLRSTLNWRKEMGLLDMHESWKETIALENATGKLLEHRP